LWFRVFNKLQTGGLPLTNRELNALLGGWEGYDLEEVKRYQPDEDRPRAEIHVVLRPQAGTWRRCSGCGQEVMHIHDVEERWVRDLPILDAETWLPILEVLESLTG